MRQELLQARTFTSVIEALEYWSKEAPLREFCQVSEFGGKEETLTFGELYEESKKTAQWLKNQGLVRGERVVLALPNSKGFLTGFLGTLMAGGVVVPVAARNKLLGGVARVAEL